MGEERLLEEDENYNNPFDDEDKWGDESGFPSEWKEGSAWVKCRLISPTGMDSDTTIPSSLLGRGR